MEKTFKWEDVVQKAKRIFLEDGVKVYSVVPKRAKSMDKVRGLLAYVTGDHDVYDTRIAISPGSRKVLGWTCTCPWGYWCRDRRPSFRRFENRMCSHALALYYFYQSGIMKREWEKWKVAMDIDKYSEDEFFELVKREHEKYERPGVRARNVPMKGENALSHEMEEDEEYVPYELFF